MRYNISTAQESMLQAPPVTAGGMGQASRQERHMKAGLSLNPGACLAGQTGTQRPSCVSSWLGYWAATLPARRILAPRLCPRHFSQETNTSRQVCQTVGRTLSALKRATLRVPKSSSNFQSEALTGKKGTLFLFRSSEAWLPPQRN